MSIKLSDEEMERLRKDHFGLNYSEFLQKVCEDCKCKCWLGEEHCEKLTRMSWEYGFR
jgi:hypothetical protein